MKDDKYAETIKAYSKMGEEYLRATSELLPPKFKDFLKLIPKKGLALDVGCAGGRDSKRLAKIGLEVLGIDVADVFLEYARKNVPEAEFLKMDVLKLDFPYNKFDCILANAVLLHLEKKEVSIALKNLHKVLKTGGKIFIGVKMGRDTSYKTDKLSGEKRKFVYYEKDEIEEVVEKSGFKILFSNICDDGGGREDVKWIMIAAEK